MSDLVVWYGSTARKTRDPRFSTELSKNLSQLRSVIEATKIVLEPTGWNQLDWDYDGNYLVVEHCTQGRLPLSALSDGVRNTVALVADIARRCACLNPHLGEDAARKTPGVLLIDEVDMHLHPGWQQQVIELLCRAFQSMQIVLSTHSPHVLSTVERKSIRRIHLHDGDGILETPQFQTRGVESADVLAAIMGVDPIPHIEEAQWLSNYRALIQQHLLQTPEADALRPRLEAHFGIHHPVILECDRIIRLERFRQSLPATSNPERG